MFLVLECVFLLRFLGLPVIFKQRAYSDEERIDLLRRMYGYGGLFAVEAGSYANFLLREGSRANQEVFIPAIRNELIYAKNNRLETQENLRAWIEKDQSNLVAEEQFSFL